MGSSSPSYGPSPAPGGLVGWVRDRVRLFRYRNKRTATGAYEGQSYGPGYSRGAAAADDDYYHEEDPWDSRVGAYHPYEMERELALVPPPAGTAATANGGAPQPAPEGEGYQMNLPVDPQPARGNATAAASAAAAEEEERGRARNLSSDPERAAERKNPFADDAEPSNISVRDASSRPADTSFAARKAARGEEDRRSMFREDV